MLRRFLLVPRGGGIAGLLLAGAGLCVGISRGEIVLFLAAFMLCVTLAYSLVAVAALSLLHRRSALSLGVRILPESVPAGGEAGLYIDGDASPRFVQLPAVLVRYRLRLKTKDNKKIERVFGKDFFRVREASFSVGWRGAYFGASSGVSDELVICDVFGFFEGRYRISGAEGARLRVMPSFTRGLPRLPRLSRGGEHRSKDERVVSEELSEHRPYVPGDDPRRINWKLYGHLGELFVREKDFEPPTRTRLALVLCTESESPDDADLICETALAVGAECARNNVSLQLFGNTFESALSDPATLAQTLAMPYAVSARERSVLPEVNAECTVIAVPRGPNEKSFALDDFIARGRNKITILFVYCDERREGAAFAEALRYGRMSGVTAHGVRV